MIDGLRGRAKHRANIGRRLLRDRALGANPDIKTVREDLALRYLRGEGIEIGALNFPLRLPPGVSVRYVDYLPADTLRSHHAHLIAVGAQLTMPDLVDDGERLSLVDDESVDFVVANHVIEHVEDPISTLQHQVRVLRPGGTLYLAVPDGRMSFDRDRPLTTLDHVLHDHEQGPDVSRDDHYIEWARSVDRIPDERLAAHVGDLRERRFSIHFHVWTLSTFVELLVHCMTRLDLPIELVHAQRNGEEFVVIASKAKP